MEIALRKYGNSTVVVLPPSVLKDLGLAASQIMTLQTTPDRKITLAPKAKYNLADMLAECDFDAAPPADMVAWDAAKQVGNELW
ncbi:MAG: ChpB-ChpS toxin-antitoxin system antitoxin [Candidatus Symbiobacter sp.]|nr:ChpB-ChpS toxin-antitoxin system antitoxin [Candidatus Symbiobacter sp.]